MVNVIPLNAEQCCVAHRLGFMQGEMTVPDDFDEIGSAEITRLFSGVSRMSFGVHSLDCAKKNRAVETAHSYNKVATL